MKTYQLTLDDDIYTLKETPELADSFNNIIIDSTRTGLSDMGNKLMDYQGNPINIIILANKKLNINYKIGIDTIYTNLCNKYIFHNRPELTKELDKLATQYWGYSQYTYRIYDGFICRPLNKPDFNIEHLKDYFKAFSCKSIELKDKIKHYDFKVKDDTIQFKYNNDIKIIKWSDCKSYLMCNDNELTNHEMDNYFDHDNEIVFILGIMITCIGDHYNYNYGVNRSSCN